MRENGHFQLRRFISLLITIDGLVMLVSGLVFYAMPEGRIAYWTDWRLIGLDKEQWGTVHTCFGFLFFIACGVHLYYNWRTLLGYLKVHLTQRFTLGRELIIALLLSLLFLHGSIVGYAPFTSTMDLGKSLKKSWYAGQDVHPPFPHAELMPLRQLARRVDFNLQGALQHLKGKGLPAESGDVTLKELATGSPWSPKEIFETMMMDDRLYR